MSDMKKPTTEKPRKLPILLIVFFAILLPLSFRAYTGGYSDRAIEEIEAADARIEEAKGKIREEIESERSAKLAENSDLNRESIPSKPDPATNEKFQAFEKIYDEFHLDYAQYIQDSWSGEPTAKRASNWSGFLIDSWGWSSTWPEERYEESLSEARDYYRSLQETLVVIDWILENPSQWPEIENRLKNKFDLFDWQAFKSHLTYVALFKTFDHIEAKNRAGFARSLVELYPIAPLLSQKWTERPWSMERNGSADNRDVISSTSPLDDMNRFLQKALGSVGFSQSDWRGLGMSSLLEATPRRQFGPADALDIAIEYDQDLKKKLDRLFEASQTLQQRMDKVFSILGFPTSDDSAAGVRYFFMAGSIHRELSQWRERMFRGISSLKRYHDIFELVRSEPADPAWFGKMLFPGGIAAPGAMRRAQVATRDTLISLTRVFEGRSLEGYFVNNPSQSYPQIERVDLTLNTRKDSEPNDRQAGRLWFYVKSPWVDPSQPPEDGAEELRRGTQKGFPFRGTLSQFPNLKPGETITIYERKE